MNTPENKQGKESIFVESLKRPNLWLVILVVILTIAFYLLDIQASWDSSVLTLLLNIVFVVIPAFFIALVSSRGFLQSGSWQIMWLGVGTLTYGLAVLLSFWVRTWASANAQTTTFTIVYLLASLFFFIGSLIALNKASIKAFSSLRGRLTNLLLIYFIVVALISLTTFVSIRELLPPFFIQGEGSTGLRIILQIIALLLFLVSALLIITHYLKLKTAFLLWYGLGLILTVVNTAGNLVLTSFGTPLNWVLRGAQLLAGVYLLMAAVTIVREAKVRRLPTGEALARLLSTTEAALREKEAALKVSEERYRLAVAAADDAIWDIDLNTGSVYWNETYTAKFGRPPETSNSWQWWIDRIHPEERERVASSLRAAIDSLDISWVREYRFQRTDGLWANIYDRAYIARDESGKAWRVVGAMQDITERKKAEEVLRESEAKYRNLFVNMTEGFAFCDIITDSNGKPIDYRVLEVNQAWEEMTGLSAARISGKPLKELIPDLEQYWVDSYGKVALTGEPMHIENYNKFTNHWYEIYAYSPRKGYFVSLVQNITDRKKAEEALRESEEKYKSMAENVPSVLMRYDRDCRVVYLSHASEAITGKPVKEFIGKTNREVGMPEHLCLLWEDAIQEVFQTGQNKSLEFDLPSDQGVRTFYLKFAPELDLEGRVAHVLGISTEITDRKKAEEQLRQRAEELETVMNVVPAAIWVAHDPKCHNITGNPTANEFYEAQEGENVSASSAAGEPVPPRRFFHNGKEMKAEDLPMQEAAARNQDINGSEFEVKLPSGKSRMLWGSASPLRDAAGQVRGAVAAFLDITARKEAEKNLQKYTEELETANKELETFSYSVSHDLRSPLRTLDGFSEMIITEYGDKLDETGKDYLNRVRKASQTMSRLIDDILKLSRISRAELHREKIVLSDLAKSIAGELQTSQPERQAEFIVNPELTVMGDKNLLDIGLRNLLENAWKYSSKCSHTRIEFGVLHQKGEQVYFVRDNGVGFDMKYSDKLFQPFHRLHNDKDYPGTGIGLATVQRIIHRHNGRIWAESEVGKGTTFYFTIG